MHKNAMHYSCFQNIMLRKIIKKSTYILGGDIIIIIVMVIIIIVINMIFIMIMDLVSQSSYSWFRYYIPIANDKHYCINNCHICCEINITYTWTWLIIPDNNNAWDVVYKCYLCNASELQNCKTTKPQNHKTTYIFEPINGI